MADWSLLNICGLSFSLPYLAEYSAPRSVSYLWRKKNQSSPKTKMRCSKNKNAQHVGPGEIEVFWLLVKNASTPAPPGTGKGKSKAIFCENEFQPGQDAQVGPMRDEATDSSRILLAQWRVVITLHCARRTR